MRRRDLVAVIAFALTGGRAARAASGRARIAVLFVGSKGAYAAFFAALLDGLRAKGYVDGQTADLDVRYADGDVSRLSDLVKELLRLKPDVMLADGPSAAAAAQSVAPSLPVVCPLITPALVPKLAASFAHPGGNLTGFATTIDGMMGKQLELTLEAVPGATRIGLLVNPSSVDAFIKSEIAAAAQMRRIEVVVFEAATLDDLRKELGRLAATGIHALIVPANALFIGAAKLIVESALKSRVPIVGNRQFIDPGGLASYGVDTAENYRLAAGYIDKIVKGAAPGDLPIQFPKKFQLVINLKTAKALGIAIPQTLLFRADEVIE